MTNSSQPPYGTSDARTPAGTFFDAVRRTGLMRTPDRWIGGVAAGIAHKLGIAPGFVRLLLVVLVVFFGLSLWVYLIAWLLMPDQTTGRSALEALLT